jgi:hypothetical protein
MVAGLVILAGLIPVGVAVGTGIQLANRGRFRAEAALGVMSRIEQLRAIAGRSSADCAALGSGSAVVHGRQERWTVGGSFTVREVAVSVTVPHPRAPVTDSVLVHFRCP